MDKVTTFDDVTTPGELGKPVEETEIPNLKTNQGKAMVALAENGMPMPKNIEEEYRVAEALLKGRGLPEWVKTPVQAFVVSQFSRAFGFQPIVGVQFMQMVNGRLSLWGEGPLAAVRNSGKLEWISEFFITEKYEVISWKNKNLDAPIFAAVCEVKRFGAPSKEFVFTAKDADQVQRGIEAIWKKWRGIMMKRKARAIALKDEFGDVLLGAPIAEYNFHTAPDFEKDIGPTQTQSLEEKLNARLVPAPQAQEQGATALN